MQKSPAENSYNQEKLNDPTYQDFFMLDRGRGYNTNYRERNRYIH